MDPPPPLPPPPPATPQQNTAVDLPPGVYFNPTCEEAMHNYLNQWIAGETIPEMEAGFVARADVYGEGPDALRRRHRPGYWCNYVYKWFFLSHHKRQSSCRTSNKRAERLVAAGGRWKVEQGKKVLGGSGGGGGGGERDSLGFYSTEKSKTSWIMEEYTSSVADGAAAAARSEDRMVPVLCKIYLSPRATIGEKRALFGEDGVEVEPDGSKKKARVMVLVTLFDDVEALLGQPVAAAALATPQPVPGDVGHHHQGHFAAALPARGDLLGHGHFDDVAARFGQVAVAALPASGDLGHGYFDDAAALLGQVAMAPAPALGHHQQGYVVTEALPESGYLGHYHHDGHFAQAAAPEQDYLGYHSHDAHVAELTPEQGYLGQHQGHLAAAAPDQDYHDDAHVAVAAPEQGDLGHDQGHFAAALTPEECYEIVRAYEFHPEMVQMLSMGFAVPNEQFLPQLLDPTDGGYDMASSATAAVGDVHAHAAAAAPTPQIRPNATEAMAATATVETMPPPLDAVAAELSAPPRGLPPELAFNALPSAQQEPSCDDDDDDDNFGELVAEAMPPLILENADADAGSDEPLQDLAGIMPELDFGHDLRQSAQRMT